MNRHLVNVERRYSMQPGALPDKEKRMSLGVGWIVTAIDADTGHHIAILINALHGDDNYTGTVVNQLTSEPVRLQSHHVYQIISIKEPIKEKKNEKKADAKQAKANQHHAIQTAEAASVQEIWAAIADRLPGRAARRQAHPAGSDS